MRFLGYMGGVLGFIGLVCGVLVPQTGLTFVVIGLIIMLVAYWFTFDEE